MKRGTTIALAAGGLGALAFLLASTASADSGPPTAPPHPPKPPPDDEPPPTDDEGDDEDDDEGDGEGDGGTPDIYTDVDLWTSDVPSPNMFYQTRRGDRFLGTNADSSIVFRALRELGKKVGMQQKGLDELEAERWADGQARSNQIRLAYYDLILCLAYNDALFGTWGYDKAINRPGPHGRAIRLLAQNADLKRHFEEGLPLPRNVAIGDHMSPGDKSGVTLDSSIAGHYPLLWLPGISWQDYADGIVVESSPMDLPHPQFAWRLDIQESELPPNRLFGCGEGTRQF